ncbi:Pyruvate decarboxylase [Exophiala dermatitidis]
MPEQIDLAEYLFRRLYEAGARSVHGVPGDYNLVALDYIVPAGLDWAGNCNELNAGYAADGYGRVKGISALVTTFGVGELSAINAIACAYTEMSPVVHIVGTPDRKLQAQGAKLHHSLCNGEAADYRAFADMAVKITVAQENLTDINQATMQIDSAIRTCVLYSRPVYIQLPTDMVTAKVATSSLLQPLNLARDPNDEETQAAAVEEILSKIYQAKQAFILVDGGASRYGISQSVNALVKATGFPTATTPYGKGIVNETLSNFHGVYSPVGKHVYVDWVKSCDLVLNFGPHGGNVNTYFFTTQMDPKVTIAFHQNTILVARANESPREYSLHAEGVLKGVLARLDSAKIPKFSSNPNLPDPRKASALLPTPKGEDKLSQDIFWTRISRIFQPGDIVLTETGTASVGGREFILPENATLINSSIWLSIGFILGAAQGAALALRDLALSKGRTILFEGDGSLQMTVQEFSTIIRKRLDMIVFVINNNGYTIERLIHGRKAHYNDIAQWRYLETASYFGAPVNDVSYPVKAVQVTTWKELDQVLSTDEFKAGKGFTLVELIMEPEDACDTLQAIYNGHS